MFKTLGSSNMDNSYSNIIFSHENGGSGEMTANAIGSGLANLDDFTDDGIDIVRIKTTEEKVGMTLTFEIS